ncbi:MAG: hypothetical protein QOD95_952, partial [Gammaproteobacteria bacterium]|nr:hypothetical protein [Gammaproteobacteria bacterium]
MSFKWAAILAAVSIPAVAGASGP